MPVCSHPECPRPDVPSFLDSYGCDPPKPYPHLCPACGACWHFSRRTWVSQPIINTDIKCNVPGYEGPLCKCGTPWPYLEEDKPSVPATRARSRIADDVNSIREAAKKLGITI